MRNAFDFAYTHLQSALQKLGHDVNAKNRQFNPGNGIEDIIPLVQDKNLV